MNAKNRIWNRLTAATLALLLCLGLTAPTLAAGSGTPEITWVTVEGTVQSCTYISELDHVMIESSNNDGMYRTFVERATGARIEDYYYIDYYPDPSPFSEGLALVGKYDADANRIAYGYIDTTGAVVIPLEYDELIREAFSEGLAIVHGTDADGNTKYGFVDQTGTVVVPLEYDYAANFSEGLAEVVKKDADGNYKWGYYHEMGQAA